MGKLFVFFQKLVQNSQSIFILIKLNDLVF